MKLPDFNFQYKDVKPYTMKYLVFLLMPAFASAQIQVQGSSKKFTIGKIANAELYGIIIESDTTYALQFKNGEYRTISDYQSISFKDEGGTLEDLYKTFSSVFADENKKNKEYNVRFKLGNIDVIVSNYTTMGIVYASFWSDKGLFYVNEKQLKKLFNK